MERMSFFLMLICIYWSTTQVLQRKKTGTLIDASKEVVLEAKSEKTKYMWLSLRQNAEKNCDTRIGDTSFKTVAQFRYCDQRKGIQTLFRKKL
jgi:hypothetical protein